MMGLEVSFVGGLAFGLIALAALLSLLRLLLGPTVPDRVVAADTLGIITTAGLAWFAGALGNGIYVDVALVYGALAFIGVVAVARAIERQAESKGDGQ